MWSMRAWLATLATVAVALQTYWTIIAFVHHRDFQGGPHAYIDENDGDWVNVVLNGTSVLNLVYDRHGFVTV